MRFLNKGKQLARSWMPPALYDFVRKRLYCSKITYSGRFASFKDASSNAGIERPWSDTTYLANQKQKYQKFCKDTLPDGFEVCMRRGLYMEPLWAKQSSDIFRVLDFGGGAPIEFNYFINAAPFLRHLQWIIADTRESIEAAKSYIHDDRIEFVESSDRSLLEGSPWDLIHCSGTLQFIDDPWEVLDWFASLNAPYLILRNLPLVEEKESAVTIAKLEKGIGVKHPVWVFGSDMWNLLKQNWSVSFKSYDNDSMPGFTERNVNLLLKRKHFSV
jgi:putative methyltransferase (TIGR04325 family)